MNNTQSLTEFDNDRYIQRDSVRYVAQYLKAYGFEAIVTHLKNIIFVSVDSSTPGKYIYVTSTKASFTTTSSFKEGTDIAFQSVFDWNNSLIKADAYMLLSIPTKHMIVLGRSTSNSWVEVGSLNGFDNHLSPYYACSQRYWRNSVALVQRLKDKG